MTLKKKIERTVQLLLVRPKIEKLQKQWNSLNCQKIISMLQDLLYSEDAF